jgi:hypothetical protein
MSHHLFQAQQLNGHEHKKWYERNVLFSFLAQQQKNLFCYPAIKQKNDKWTEEYRKNLLESRLSR